MSENQFVTVYAIGFAVTLTAAIYRIVRMTLPGYRFRFLYNLAGLLRSGGPTKGICVLEARLSTIAKDLSLRIEQKQSRDTSNNNQKTTIARNIAVCLRSFVALATKETELYQLDYTKYLQGVKHLVAALDRHFLGLIRNHKFMLKLVRSKEDIYFSLLGSKTSDVHTTAKLREDFVEAYELIQPDADMLRKYIEGIRQWTHGAINNNALRNVDDSLILPLFTLSNMLPRCLELLEGDDPKMQNLASEKILKIQGLIKDDKMADIVWMGLTYDEELLVEEVYGTAFQFLYNRVIERRQLEQGLDLAPSLAKS